MPKVSETIWDYRSGMGWRDLLMGLPFVAFGVFLLQVPLRLIRTMVDASDEVQVVSIVVGCIFCLGILAFVWLGVRLAFNFTRTVIDMEKKTVTVVEGVLFLRKSKVAPLASSASVELRSVKSSSGGRGGRQYYWRSEVRLRSKKLFKIESCLNAHRATELAGSLAQFLQCEIIDKRKPQLMS